MSNTQTIQNTLTSTALNKQYYDRRLLETAKTKFVFSEFGQKRVIPKHNGKSVEFRKWDLFDPNDAVTPLTEGVTPDGQSLSQSVVTAEVEQYGAYVEVSDVLDMTGYDRVIDDSAELLGEQLGTVIEWVVRDELTSGTNVQYAGGKTARSALTDSDKLTVQEIRKAVRTLKKAKARKFTAAGKRDHFICICSPEAVYDLQTDADWRDASLYAGAEQIYTGEIGMLYGVVFVESSEAKVFEGGVHATLVFGRDAYGVVDLGGQGALSTIIKPHGSAGSADPLDQRATVGAKVNGLCAKLLNQLWLVRIEHKAS